MGWFKEGKRGQRPDGFYYLTEEYVQETCNTKEWRRCSEQFTYWKEDFDKRFTEKKVCDKCGKNVRYDPVRKVFMRHWCKKIKLSKLWFLTISKASSCTLWS